MCARAALGLLCAVLLSGAELTVKGGLADDQVVQRAANGRADFRLSGVATVASGTPVEARVLQQYVALEGFDWTPICRVEEGRWAGEIKRVPAGGPYRVEVRIAGAADAAAVTNVLVGDLWVLAGQSNMQGYGDLVDVQPPDLRVHSFDLADHWLVAEEPLHTTVSAVDRFHWSYHSTDKPPLRYEGERLRRFLAQRKKGAGLGLPFAVEMVRRTGVPVGLIPCAHGATRMDQWDPALKNQGGDSLYGSLLRRFQAAGGRVAGMLWYQGESDSSAEAAPLFQAKFERFVAAVRADFGQSDLPFYYVQLARAMGAPSPYWNVVQEAQRKAEREIPRSGMVAAIDATLDDGIHVGTQSHKVLGHRLANLACHDLFPAVKDCAEIQRGPRPVSASYHDGVVRVLFAGANGRLQSAGRLHGFTIHTASDEVWPYVYKQEVDPASGDAVLLHISNPLPPSATLRYGYGSDPYCNLIDQMEMAAPAFGPIPIQP